GRSFLLTVDNAAKRRWRPPVARSNRQRWACAALNGCSTRRRGSPNEVNFDRSLVALSEADDVV
ncbi:MAG: hypothetical protein VX728_05750, partial [Actinomycetota bacterium]|nr:hypothetical protein [Actinomycetota bacterium]